MLRGVRGRQLERARGKKGRAGRERTGRDEGRVADAVAVLEGLGLEVAVVEAGEGLEAGVDGGDRGWEGRDGALERGARVMVELGDEVGVLLELDAEEGGVACGRRERGTRQQLERRAGRCKGGEGGEGRTDRRGRAGGRRGSEMPCRATGGVESALDGESRKEGGGRGGEGDEAEAMTVAARDGLGVVAGGSSRVGGSVQCSWCESCSA